MKILATTCALAIGFATAAGAEAGRTLVKETVVPAPIGAVWNSWTSEAGLRFISDRSNVDLRFGGAYEWFLDLPPDAFGKRGGEGARILAFMEPKMLAFSWTFPPTIPELRHGGATTQVVVELEPAEGDQATRVRLEAVGWGEGPAWDEGYEYFDSAWGFVLDALRKHHEARNAPPANRSEEKDGITITVIEAPDRRQEFSVDIAATRQEVWQLLTTEEGFRRLGAREPEVELRPGGPYKFWPAAPNRVLAYLPERMLATTGSAPEKFPEVRKGGTWSVIHLTEKDPSTTHLRMEIAGWKRGEAEWDEAFDYFLDANPAYLAMLRQELEKGD